MKKLIMFLTVVMAALVVTAQTTFQVIPPRNVVAGNKFYVKFKVSNGESGAPKGPAIEGCKLLSPSPGRSTMSSVQVINGQMSSNNSVEYTFTYRAEKEGTFTIPSVTLNIDGKNYSTKATQFKVLPQDKNARPSQQQQQGWDPWGDMDDAVIAGDMSSQTSDKKIGKEDIFVRIILNKQHVYEQEAVECTIKLYTKFQSIVSFMATTPPTFDGFLIDEVDVQGQLNNMENFNGQNYLTAVLKKAIIFPQKSGKLTINSGRYELTVQTIDRVFNGWYYSARPIEKKVVLAPYTSTVTISPLPEPRPAGFTNAVGDFKFESRLTPENIRTGEAASLTYIVTGTGNIKYLDIPKPELPSEFEQYSPKTDNRARVNGSNVTGTATCEFTFVPQSVGEFKIPPMDFVYFNPATGKYVTEKTQGYEMKVEKGNGATTGVEQSDIKLKNTDILHIHVGDKNLQKTHDLTIDKWWYWTIYGLLLVALFAGAWLLGRRSEMLADVAGRKNAKAGKVAQKRLRVARKFLDEGKSEDFYAELLSAMWGYLSDKLSIPVSQLNRQNITEALETRGVDPTLTEAVLSVLDTCEMARYTPDSGAAGTLSHVYDEAAEAINRLDRTKLLKKA